MPAVKKYHMLEEEALLNLELLMQHWGLVYEKNGEEFDFLSPGREDAHLGACKFNRRKGTGADFAGYSYTPEDMQQIATGFDRDDFCNLATTHTNSWGFDIVTLCGRIHNCQDYAKAAILLRSDLKVVRGRELYTPATPEGLSKRKDRNAEEFREKIKRAQQMWDRCRPIQGTKAETYLASRGILGVNNEPNIRYHEAMRHVELQKFLPAVVFKVQPHPRGELQAIHRIYLNETGTGKVEGATPKMAFGVIRGGGIWFGRSDESVLGVAEGPENALSVLCMGRNATVSAVSAVNFGSLRIPYNFKSVILYPDTGEAGEQACARAVQAYQEQGKHVSYNFPPNSAGSKKVDWNDVLKSGECPK